MGFWLIIVIGALLIALNLRSIKKEKNSFEFILDEKVDNMADFEVLIGEVRREFAETILELQKSIQEVNEKIEVINKKEQKKAEVYNKLVDNEINKSVIETTIEEVGFTNSGVGTIYNVKVKEIDELLKQGMDIGEIAERLSMGKGEVLLIKELYLK